ncbi:MAG: DUF4835 family protein [Bacteroidales bacterium]|jgi:hypothetical protein|nr:DUF4835 family protein [Bacteroidales bacterium]
MRKIKIIFLSLIIFTSLAKLSAQEFLAQVMVNTAKVQTSDRTKYDNLQRDLYEFVNSRTWSNFQFRNEERIECSIMITLDDPGASNDMKGSMNVQLRRPVYGSSYNTVLLNYVDKDVEFRFIENEPLDYVENTFTNNLTSLIAFYLNMFLGLDFDSYSQNGGSEFYQKANTIVNTCQNRAEPGWKSFENQRNRYWMVENLLNSSYAKVREFLYVYHRLGLDAMSENVEQARQKITESLELLQMANRERPGLFIISVIVSAKSDEIINIYSEANPSDKQRVVNIMREIDPANASKYQQIMNNK